MTNNDQSLKSSGGGQGEIKHFDNELKIFYNYLHVNVATASMVAYETSIPHKNICRYKRMLEVKGKIFQIERKACKRTGNLAWYLSTNPDHVNKSNFNKDDTAQDDANADGQFDMFHDL